MPTYTPKIWSRFDRPEAEESPAGTYTEPEYTEYIDENGHLSLKQTGETPTYEMIQAALEETKIENIIRRATLGDPTALAATQGAYLDTTNMPTSLAEMQEAIIKTTNEFNDLPLEIRLKFDQSAEKYISMYGTEEWANIMGISKQPETKQNEPVNTEGGETK
nr:virion structural protein [Microvirus sp.]